MSFHPYSFLSLLVITFPNCPIQGRLARSHVDVTLMFMDMVGFTAMSKEVEAADVMVLLNQVRMNGRYGRRYGRRYEREVWASITALLSYAAGSCGRRFVPR